ncbi:hypothetical protein AB0I51_23370 [Streptomyces sp. NPDC050549]|uniref:DUF1918 domain-containing protein n=1 Tax=Streptomyces sp. NPDC050549 TaxID=3155406 RepID=UPI00341AC41E
MAGSPVTGATGRDGGIVGLHREAGTPPHVVRRSDSDGVTPGRPVPDASADLRAAARAAGLAGPAPGRRQPGTGRGGARPGRPIRTPWW